MSPIVLPILVVSLALGTTMALTSSHWFFAWMGLEINTLAIIPIMLQKHHPRVVEATTKYFLAQSTAAATLLFAAITNAWLFGLWHIEMKQGAVPHTMLILSLSLKLGLAPLHSWLPDVLQAINFPTGLLLSTWQKIAPFSIMIQTPHFGDPTLVLLGLTSVIIGGLAGINQTQLRKMLAYSSIAHMGWMILIIEFSPSLTVLAFCLYIIITSAAFLTFMCFCATNINKLSAAWTKTPLLTTTFPLSMLSAAGIPPMSGFYAKWMILTGMAKQAFPLFAMIVAGASVFSTYFYVRLAYVLTLTSSPNVLTNSTSWRPHKKQVALAIALTVMLSMLLLPIGPGLTAITSR